MSHAAELQPAQDLRSASSTAAGPSASGHSVSYRRFRRPGYVSGGYAALFAGGSTTLSAGAVAFGALPTGSRLGSLVRPYASLMHGSGSHYSTLDETELVQACLEEHKAVNRRVLDPVNEMEEVAGRIAELEQLHNTQFVKLIGEKLKEYNVVPPRITLEFSDLNVKTQALVGSAGIPTVGNQATGILKVKDEKAEVSHGRGW